MILHYYSDVVLQYHSIIVTNHNHHFPTQAKLMAEPRAEEMRYETLRIFGAAVLRLGLATLGLAKLKYYIVGFIS